MAKDLGFIDVENNNLPDLAIKLGALKGTNIAAGLAKHLSVPSSGDFIDWYSFKLDATAGLNSYIELSSIDVANVDAYYEMQLYKYNSITKSYEQLLKSYPLNNNPFDYRIDLTSLQAGTYLFSVVGAERPFGNATGLYNLRISIPSAKNPGQVINGTNSSEQLLGGNAENTINGKSGDDTLIDNGGDDTLYGGDGNDILVGGANSDLLNGGSGIDQVVEFDYVDQSGQFFKFILTNSRLIGNGVDALVGIEQAALFGGDSYNTLDASKFTLGSVYLDGEANEDTLLGGTKDDYLFGGEGFDFLNGGTGRDTLTGGPGGDTYVLDNIGDVVVEATAVNDGYDRVEASVTHTLGATVEELTLTGTAAINGTGSELNNKITGNSASNTLKGAKGDDTLDGGAGVDTLIGGTGNDAYIVDRTTDVIQETSTTDIDFVEASATYTLAANLENLQLYGANVGTGNNLNNRIMGDSAGNILNGVGGNDIVYGHNGNDTLNGGNGDDFLYGMIGNDVINGGNGNDYISGLDGKDIFNGGAGKDYLTDGIDNNDTYVFRFGESSVFAPDQIESFAFDDGDRIDLLSQGGSALGKPTRLTRAADDEYPYSSLEDLVKQVFTDANGKLAGNQALGVNSAALVDGAVNDYLIINDGTAAFQANKDLVIDMGVLLYGQMTPSSGVLPVDSFFI